MTATTDRRFLWLFFQLAFFGVIADQTSKYIVFSKLYSETAAAPSIVVIPDLFHIRASHLHYKKDANGQWMPYTIRDSGDEPLSFLRTISGACLPSVNRGALFGIGNADAESGGWNLFFLVVSVGAAVLIVLWTMRPSVKQDWFLCLALGLILGGTLGNLYDRLIFHGVRDFLHFFYGGHTWPDFNVADCCLVCGAAALMAHSFFAKEPKAAIATSETPAEATISASSPSV